MRISDLISMCLGNLFRRKLRTVLTITAVVVGTAMIVVMISIGLAMTQSQEAMLAQMGDLTLIKVYNWNQQNPDLILDDAAVAKMAAMPGVDVATPLYEANFQVRIFSGKKDRYRLEMYSMVGMYAEAIPKMGYQLLEGKYPEGEALPKKPIHVLIGEDTAYGFEDTKRKYDNRVWPEPNPITGELKKPFVDMMNDEMTLKTYNWDDDEKKDNSATTVTRELVVAGRVKQDNSKGYETARGMYMDINDLKAIEEEYNKLNKSRANNDRKGYNQVMVKVDSMETVDPVETEIKKLGFETDSMETMRKPMQEQVKQQQSFLGIIGLVTLVVAAIGIANTMYMSIYERTREIGVMKVLGCRVGNIRSIFLMEAGVIGFVGGCFGVGVSYLLSYLMNKFNFSISGIIGNTEQMNNMMGGMGGDPSEMAQMAVSVIPPWLIGSAIIFATLIGLASGILPASRAMRISALEAIKHD